MKFLLISHHIGGEVPENEKEQNVKAMGEWFTLLQPVAALPVNDGKTITSESVQEYTVI